MLGGTKMKEIANALVRHRHTLASDAAGVVALLTVVIGVLAVPGVF